MNQLTIIENNVQNRNINRNRNRNTNRNIINFYDKYCFKKDTWYVYLAMIVIISSVLNIGLTAAVVDTTAAPVADTVATPASEEVKAVEEVK